MTDFFLTKKQTDSVLSLVKVGTFYVEKIDDDRYKFKGIVTENDWKGESFDVHWEIRRKEKHIEFWRTIHYKTGTIEKSYRQMKIPV